MRTPSGTRRIVRVPVEAMPDRAGQRRALVVGIDTYSPTHPDLTNARNDAVALAQLEMSGCVFAIFRNTELAVDGVASQSAPVCLVHNSHGTLYAVVSTDTVVGTDWAVVTASGTEFLVYVNQEIGLVWVIVADGYVEVEAAGVLVGLGAGEQVWVWRGEPPVGPVPARRSEVPDQVLFPPIEEPTNGEIPDGQPLEQPAPPAALGVTLKQSTDVVQVPECGGVRSAGHPT